MPASIGVNLRVTGHCSQGGRKYMEDLFSVAYQQTEDERDLEYAFFGIYDGHGGSEAAAFAKEHLMDSIVKQRQFWSDDDEDVLKAIRNGYMLTHLNMWKELEKWPKTVTGLPSTAGTTASVAFIRRGKIYVGHVGDSAIVLGYQKDGTDEWAAKALTSDHKPESTAEMDRIQRCGGKVISKAGVPRVVWNRPRVGHKDPVKKTTPIDEIPFLAVARALGDLWSYNSANDEFVVSPDPDVGVLTIDPTKFRCLIFGTDGLWNMISPEGAVSLVQATERHNEAALVGANGGQPKDWLNPSKSLVDHALQRWSNTRMRADNTSVVTLMLDPPGPPRAAVLRARAPPAAAVPPPPRATPRTSLPSAETVPDAEPAPPLPQNGLTIMTRYSDVDRTPAPPAPAAAPAAPEERLPPCASLAASWREPDASHDVITNYGNPAESYFMTRLLSRHSVVNTLGDVYDEIVSAKQEPREPSPPPPPCTALPDEAAPPEPPAPASPVSANTPQSDDVSIQINEVSSSSPTECPRGGRPRRHKPPREPGPCARVLRSHEPSPQRPATRQAARRQPPAPAPAPAAAPAPPPPALERVVILSRSHAPDQPARCTRSRDAAPPAAPAPAAPAPRSTPGNAARAAGPARRPGAPGPRRRAAPPPAPDCSKENRVTTRRRAAPPAPCPPRPPPPRRRPAEPEPEPVHSTTHEDCARRLQLPPAPRALRSRNEAAPAPAPSTPAPAKRPRCEAAASKAAGRSLARRAAAAAAAAPWAPALALRNRLRKRLAK